ARDKIADMIAKAENKKTDPLAALKNAVDQLDKLLKEQIETRDQTKDAGDAKQPDRLPEIAPQQKDLAQRTDTLKDSALPLNKKSNDSLDKAARAMDKATDQLQQQKADNAIGKQNDAIKALEDAKKNLQDQMAEIEK